MHTLAADLHMTVGQLLQELTLDEFQDWIAWYAERDRRMAADKDLKASKPAPVQHDWKAMEATDVAALWGAKSG